MHKEIADKLSAALTSGEYGQAKLALRTADDYCCLGVLCDLYRKEVDPTAEWCGGVFLGEANVLPREVQEWAGMRSDNGGFARSNGETGYATECLSGLNDNGMSFNEISEVIQERYGEL